jgi:hypothetical protein
MSKKRFKVDGNYFVITDVNTGVEDLRLPRRDIRYTCVLSEFCFIHESDSPNRESTLHFLFQDIVNGNNEDNPFTDENDLKTYLNEVTASYEIYASSIGQGVVIQQQAENFSALVDGIEIGDIAYVESSQGTSWLPATMGGTYYPAGFYLWDGIVWTSDRNAIALQLEANSKLKNVIQVSSLVDLPTPIGDVITLDTDGLIYQFIGPVSIDNNKIIVDAENVKLLALNPATDGIISSTTGVVITANKGLSINNIFIVGATASDLVKGIGTGVQILTTERVSFIGGNCQVNVTNFDIQAYAYCFFSSGVDGIKTFGLNNMSFLADRCIFRDITNIAVDLEPAKFSSIGFDLCICTNTATTTFLNIAEDSANINTGGQGTLTDCKIDLTLGGLASVGANPLDALWSYTGNNSIKTSDRILPTGWEVSFDGEIAVPTIAVTTTPVKLLIDGVGANSNITKLPNAIRGVTTLWDTTDNCIKPIANGDSYDLRIQIGFDGLLGNPNDLTLQFDIGGDTSPTIVIAEDTKSIKGASSPIIYSFPVFDLTTFFANGGQLFLNTDLGTATINSRSILIVRTSSGAN